MTSVSVPPVSGHISYHVEPERPTSTSTVRELALKDSISDYRWPDVSAVNNGVKSVPLPKCGRSSVPRPLLSAAASLGRFVTVFTCFFATGEKVRRPAERGSKFKSVRNYWAVNSFSSHTSRDTRNQSVPPHTQLQKERSLTVPLCLFLTPHHVTPLHTTSATVLLPNHYHLAVSPFC